MTKFGNTSLVLYIDVRKHNVYTGEENSFTHTNVTIVKVDKEGRSIPITETVEISYIERLKIFSKGFYIGKKAQKVYIISSN